MIWNEQSHIAMDSWRNISLPRLKHLYDHPKMLWIKMWELHLEPLIRFGLENRRNSVYWDLKTGLTQWNLHIVVADEPPMKPATISGFAVYIPHDVPRMTTHNDKILDGFKCSNQTIWKTLTKWFQHHPKTTTTICLFSARGTCFWGNKLLPNATSQMSSTCEQPLFWPKM